MIGARSNVVRLADYRRRPDLLSVWLLQVEVWRAWWRVWGVLP